MSKPTRLGRYVVRRRLGAGGFATVWLGYDEHLDSPVAIKVLADNWAADLHVRRRFVAEGRLLRRVESPHVVGVYDAGDLDDGRPYLVMAYADQGTLADRLELSPLPLVQARLVIGQVAAGLTALHQRDIVHRDVKPANVLFRSVEVGARESGEVRAMLGDLGLGKSVDASSKLTIIGGTPSFVAPEQALAEVVDARADQYSLAVLAYLLLTGAPPHRPVSLQAAGSPSPPPPMSGMPESVDKVVRRALSVSPGDRWPDVGSFVAALDDAFGGLVVSDHLAGWVPPDPEVTQAAGAPRLVEAGSGAGSDELVGGAPPSRRGLGRRLVAVLGGGALVAGGIAGYAGVTPLSPTTTVTDDSGTLEVTVPSAWAGESSGEQWTPPGIEDTYPALSVGDAVGWRAKGATASGVFVALMPSDRLPDRTPGHPECGKVGSGVEDQIDGDPSLTVVHSACPGGSVVVERLIQTAANRLLWIQVRAGDSATGIAVLDSVRTHGI